MFLQSLILLVYLTLLGHGLKTRQDGGSKNMFRPRAYQSLAIVNDSLYIHGGVISTWYNGEREGDWDTLPLSDLRVVDLGQSWNSSTVPINSVLEGDLEAVNIPYLWADNSRGRLYRWGGDRVGRGRTKVDEATLWSYRTQADNGVDDWKHQRLSNQDASGEILVGSGGASASCGGKGFAAGGRASQSTDARLGANVISLPGMVVYDFETLAWFNETTVPIHQPLGTFIFASGVCVSELASDHLFLILGGADTTLPSPSETGGEYEEEEELRPLDMITFYNLGTRTWHSQRASGNIPEGRYFTCAAGVQGPNGTYEIFIHGGRNLSTRAMRDTYILSLPGFEWFKVEEDDESFPRYAHACVAGSGGQVIVSGGLHTLQSDRWNQTDFWPNALNVFDMSSLTWSNGYKVNQEYETPQMVRAWYEAGGLDNVTWSSDEVRNLFANRDVNSPDGDGSDIDPTPRPGIGSETPVGAIAGGVVGGLAGLAIIGGLVYIFLRRRGRPQIHEVDATHTEGAKSPLSDRAELPVMPVELEQEQHGTEIDSRVPPVELPTQANDRMESQG